MEYRTIIYNAARDGNLRRLKVFLDDRKLDEVQSLLCALTFNAPPLVIACRNGHIEVVKYLISKGASVEQPGSVQFDGETIDLAPPLWAASAAGHLEIVRILVEHGAFVNNTTSTNSTPLRAACFDGHLPIVQYLIAHGADVEKANRHGHTSLMIAAFRGHLDVVEQLLAAGANVNSRSAKGNTALHDCAESGSLEILKLLLDKGATMQIDSYGLTPLSAAASIGHAQIVEYLVGELDCCTLAEKIDALELLGATFVDKKRDVVGALQFWQRALSMRYAGSLVFEGGGEASGKNSSLPPMIRKNVSNSLTPAYGYEREFETFAELDELRSDVDRVRLQAMLIRERILGTNHPDTTYYIRYRGAVYADTGDYDRCISLWNYALEIQQRIWEPLCAITQSSFVSFAELYQFMFTDAYRRLNRNREIGFDDIMDVLQAAVNELKRAIDEGGQAICTHTESKEEFPLHRMMLVCLHLLNLLCKLEGKLSSFDEYRMHWWIYQLIRLKSRGQNQATLLHMACNSNSSTINRYPVCRFPSLNVVQLLIKLGANVHETDAEGNTPLHVLLDRRVNKVDRPSIIRSLLDAGAHIDRANFGGQTPIEFIKRSGDIQPLQYQSLKCLCAKVILQNKIDFLGGRIPAHLESFMEMH